MRTASPMATAAMTLCACLLPAAAGASECSGPGYTAYDDGSLESGAGARSFVDRRAQHVMLFDLGPGVITEACVLFRYTPDFSFDPDSADAFFNLNAYRAENGRPGALLDQLTGLSVLGLQRDEARWVRVVIPSGFHVPGDAFVGVEWNPRDPAADLIYVGVDSSASTPKRSGYFSEEAASPVASWEPLGDLGLVPSYRALAIRVRHHPRPTVNLAFEPSVMVQDGRFRVEALYVTDDGKSGSAQGAPYEDASSLWYFFGPSNIELFAKVLDACGFNDHFWVFLAGATNVGVELTVTDTETGEQRSYTNPIGRTFATITDTRAFGCH